MDLSAWYPTLTQNNLLLMFAERQLKEEENDLDHEFSGAQHGMLSPCFVYDDYTCCRISLAFWGEYYDRIFSAYQGVSSYETSVFDFDLDYDKGTENMNMRLDGALLFWHLTTWSNLGPVVQALSSLGYGTYAPTKRSPLTRLYDALRAKYKHPHLVRGLKSVLGYEVVAEHKGHEMNSYEHVVSVKLDEKNPRGSSFDDVDLAWVGPPHGDLEELRALYAEEGNKLHGSKLSKALTDIVLDHGSGLALRNGRSPYWVHESLVPPFEALASALEPLGHDLHILRHEADDRAVKAVVSAFNLEMEKALEGLTTDAGGARAKRNEANRLRERLVTYETFLAQEMPTLRARIDKAEAQCVSAALGEWEDSPSLFASVG